MATISEKTKQKIGRIFASIQRQVKCDLKFSRKGTPHLLTDDGFSFCYFAAQRRIKLFTDYPNIRDRDVYSCATWQEAIDLYYELSTKEPFGTDDKVPGTIKFWSCQEYKDAQLREDKNRSRTLAKSPRTT